MLQVSGHVERDMFKRLVLYIIALLLFVGCSSPLEKSVLEPLTSKELDKVAGKDISFLATYSIVEGKWNSISTPQDSAQWRKLTYSRLHNYINTIKDEELNSPLFSNLKSRWQNEYNANIVKADSIADYWTNYLNENNPDSLVSLAYRGSESEMVRNIKKEIDTLIKAKIAIRSLKFPLDSISVVYNFSKPDSTLTENLPITAGLNFIEYNRRVYDSITVKVFPNVIPAGKQLLMQNDTAIIFEYAVSSVYADGVCYNVDTLKSNVPESVLKLIESKDDFYKEQIIREFINTSHISQGAYLKLNAEDFYSSIDSLAFRFMEL